MTETSTQWEPQTDRWVIPASGDDKFFQQVRPFAVAVAEFAELSELTRPRSYLPDSNSLAMTDIANSSMFAGGWRDDPVRFLQSSAELRLIAAEDLLAALFKTFTSSPVSVYGGNVLLRACLENCAITFRLLDPSVTTQRRLARAYNELLYNYAQQKQLPKEVQPPNLVKRQREIEECATRSGMKLISEKNKPKAIDEQRPTNTNAVRDLVASNNLGSFAYKVLCAVSHGTQFGLAQNARRIDLPTQPEIGEVAAIQLSASNCIVTLSLALMGYGAAANAVSRYFGWTSPERETAWLDALHLFREVLKQDSN